MANSINATSTGNGGLITTGDDSGVLNIQTNETTAVSIDASQNATFTNGVNLPNTFGFKNRVINGGMAINQRNTTVSYASGSNNAYCVDQFKGSKNSTGTFTLQQSTTAPTGFTKSLLLTVTGTESSLGSSSFYDVIHYIEGNNIADLGWGAAGAKTVTLSFWVRSSVTGVYSFELRNGANNRSITYNYTIAVANTWQQVTQTITGDTTGTWATDTGSGIEILFPVATGSSFTTGTTGTWQAGNYNASTSAINLMATNGATWYLTGVQLEVGTQATSFDFRSIGQEYLLCQRYYQRITPNTQGNAGDGGFITMANWTSTSAYAGYVFPIPMRTGPSGSYSALSDFAYLSNGAGRTPASIDISNNSSTRVEFLTSYGTAGTAGYAGWMRMSASGWLAFSAEL